MAFDESQYKTWLEAPQTPVGGAHCTNVEKLVDIQPSGDVNFCIDFPDYSIGNVKEASMEALWNGERAERFRSNRREKPLAVCHRCGAKYMSEL